MKVASPQRDHARDLRFQFRRRVEPILQTESAECGLACLAMVAGWHGYRTDLPTLRRRFSISLKGATLKQLIEIAGALEFGARPLRLELDELGDLKLPCILHWDLNHFVVLTRVSARGLTILDPARGELRGPAGTGRSDGENGASDRGGSQPAALGVMAQRIRPKWLKPMASGFGAGIDLGEWKCDSWRQPK